jgi:glutamate formiminotransferase
LIYRYSSKSIQTHGGNHKGCPYKSTLVVALFEKIDIDIHKNQFRRMGATTRVAPTNHSVGATLVVALFEKIDIDIHKNQFRRMGCPF